MGPTNINPEIVNIWMILTSLSRPQGYRKFYFPWSFKSGILCARISKLWTVLPILSGPSCEATIFFEAFYERPPDLWSHQHSLGGFSQDREHCIWSPLVKFYNWQHMDKLGPFYKYRSPHWRFGILTYE